MLSTTRLNIRWAKEGDSEHLFKNCTGDSRASKFLTRKAHENVSQTHKFLHNWSWQERVGSFALVIELRDNDEPIGVLVFFIRGSVAEINFGNLNSLRYSEYCFSTCS
jgi:RimJ/RimL family protein N-acetyltransferase